MSQLHEIIEIRKGKRSVKMIDALPVCNRRLKELRASFRGKDWIKFELQKSEATQKFEARPAPGAYRGGSYATIPKVVK